MAFPLRAEGQKDYFYAGAFDRSIFQEAYVKAFRNVPKFNFSSLPDLLFVLGRIEADSRISDVRWAAYLLATTFIESSHTLKIRRDSIDRQGRTSAHTVKAWRNFSPTSEVGHGKGKKYYQPVKVKRLSNGDGQITEYDGEQWIVSSMTGRARPDQRGQRMGIVFHANEPPALRFTHEDGDEQQYYGRGYVQLTWWSNYAAAGIALGQGLELLFHPNRVNDPSTAYLIMSIGMCTGTIFANGRRMAKYFNGGHTDYVGARDMVNPGATQTNKVEVAKIAELFEGVLVASKANQRMVAR
jgi:hypothetical protein